MIASRHATSIIRSVMGQASLDNFLMDSFEGAVQEVQSLADRCKVLALHTYRCCKECDLKTYYCCWG